MCGLTGFLDPRGTVPLDATARAMAATLAHRGPDADGVWADDAAGVALGHRRLSIIDLSPAGAQPMASACGRYVIAYNGEVYNAEDLRRELAAAGHAPNYRGHSDTEVIVEACVRWGVRAAVDRLVGMFAFALWDKETRTLVLARDRLGIKPLYWGEAGGLFLFASELKALHAHPGFRAEVDPAALAAYMRHNYVPAPACIYKGVFKLEPGCLLVKRAGEAARIERYWDLRRVAREGQRSPRDLTDAEAVDEADRLIGDAVKRRMVSDVPLGAFLSGGIDSSTVAALMQAHSDRPVRTFSIGFDVDGFDEAPHAAAVARHLGTDHTELYVDPGQALDVIPRLPEFYDEPFADSSQIPTYLVSALTRRHVTVALSGDGGDEVFAGYTRYAWGDLLRRRTGWLPRPLRRAAACGLHALSEEAWDRLLAVLPASRLPSHPGQKVHKLADVLAQPDDMALYRRLITAWRDPSALVPGAQETPTVAWDDGARDDVPAFMECMQMLDSLTYLPDDILTKVDRASMAVSLEARVPLLDHRVVEFAWSLPRRLRVRDGQGKWILRRVLDRYVPPALTERPKMGFGIPVDKWLRRPLRDWAEDLLSPQALTEGGLLNPAPVRHAWAEHLAGTRNRTTELWCVLMFQAWRRRWGAA
ncbi:MAG: asparagine synthase (glutamine-hydrolyzing) [Rhodospirillales bacterium CG15_BIG_FIL_POST_REV_8_21_14_020_66_15]|nr:MAG: asparagine synthase (glutamine-hydrolyzing) [Rhodospirillales bacterium CG15_BIG_FIL_POST_REV_8_21_14_020_66_15]